MNTAKPTISLILFTILQFLIHQQTQAQCPNNDWEVLRTIYESTDSTNWIKKTGWNDLMRYDRIPDDLNGVTANNYNRVTFLDLSSNGLSDSIPRAIGCLTELITLYLNGNTLIGGIPEEIGELPNLKHLYLNGNELTGSIPGKLADLVSLEILNLSNNKLSGSIPSGLGELTNLNNLNLSFNCIDDSLDIEDSGINELYSLASLTNLNLSNNLIKGTIPSNVQNLIGLTKLNLSFNMLSGNIPSELGNLVNLETLNLSYNGLGDSIPQDVCKLDNLTDLNLSNNALIGNIPSDIYKLTNLNSLNLSHNRNVDRLGNSQYGLSGNIPDSLYSLNNLSSLNLSYNNFSGNIPTNIGGLSNLIDLNLSHNRYADSSGNFVSGLSDSIPGELAQLTNLNTIYLNNNNLSGCYENKLRIFCAKLYHSSEVKINDNIFSDTWEDFCKSGDGACEQESTNQCKLNEFEALRDLHYSTNGNSWRSNVGWDRMFADTTENIDTSSCNLSLLYGVTTNGEGNVISIDLSSNNLTGTLPPGLDNLKKLVKLDLSTDTSYVDRNSISGSIPVEIGELEKLKVLNLSGNDFIDSIPKKLANLTQLRLLALHNNPKLTGTIPKEFENLINLHYLYLEGDSLTGSVPTEIANIPALKEITFNNNSLSGCYNDSLKSLCNKSYKNVDRIWGIDIDYERINQSEGNRFEASWDDFCDKNFGTCFKSQENCHRDDWLALKAFYSSTSGGGWTNNDGWNEILGAAPTDTCNLSKLYGVSLNENGRVNCLDFDGINDCNSPDCFDSDYSNCIFGETGNNLSGILPPELNKLIKLEYITIANNHNLVGELPPQLGNLSELKHLVLWENNIRGNIPVELGRLQNLTHLFLSNNKLTGEIPDELGNLSKMKYLGFCEGFEGLLPNLSNLLDLETLFIGCSKKITGPIPTWLSNLTKLEWLGFPNNKLTGPIPEELSNLSNLETLALNHNLLTGELPSELGNLTELRSLFLASNQLSGALPPNLSNLKKMEGLSIGKNQFTGNIPDWISVFSNLSLLYLSENKFDGSIPNWIGDLKKLERISLSTNRLTGNLPFEISKLSNLSLLQVDSNRLEGCYDIRLKELCDQISEPYDFGGDYPLFSSVSEGNNFITTWVDFCTNITGICDFDCSTNIEYNNATCDVINGITTLEYVINTGLLQQNNPLFSVTIITTQGENIDTVTVNAKARENNSITLPFENGNYLITIFDELGCSDSVAGTFSCACNENDVCACNNFAGTPKPLQTICYGSETNLTINDAIIESGSVLAYFLHTGDIGNTLNKNLSGIFLNDGTFPNNQQLYVSAIVGEKDIDGFPNLNDACTDISTLSTPIWFLPPFEFNSRASCNFLDNGETLIEYSLTRGIPDGSTYVVSGNDFNLNATFGTNYDFLMPNENETYTLTATDDYGCIKTITRSFDCGEEPIFGCTDPNLCNYDPMATNDDGSCILAPICNANPCAGDIAKLSGDGCDCIFETAQVLGCTDQYFFDYNESANCDDGSCSCNKEDWKVLRELYYNTGGSDWVDNTGWDIVNDTSFQTNCDLSGLKGIELNDMGRVSKIQLSGNNLQGTIPTTINNLSDLEELNLSHNILRGNISEINFNNIKVDISHNYYTFQEMQKSDVTQSGASFSPQYFGAVDWHNLIEGDAVIITTFYPSKLQNPVYRWRKDQSNMVDSADVSFTIDSVTLENVGVYTLHIEDKEMVSGLEVISMPIYLLVEGLDHQGTPVVKNEFVYEFEDESAFDDFKEIYDDFEIADSCHCDNRLLYLIKHKSEENATRVTLDIKHITEKLKDTTYIDDSNFIIGGDIIIESPGSFQYKFQPIPDLPDPASIYMLDTGMDYTMSYNTNALGVPDSTVCPEIFTRDFVQNNDATNSHGPMGFRFITDDLDASTQFSVYPLKIFNSEGESTLFKFICSLYYAIDNSANIVNVSAGYSGKRSEILENAIKYAEEKNTFIVAAAGNENVDIDEIPHYPASFSSEYRNVISVGSIDINNNKSYFSSYGDTSVTVVAQGENMAGYGGKGEDNLGIGTSFSTYFITRMLALTIARNNQLTYQEIWHKFDSLYLVDNQDLVRYTSTGKRLNIPSCRLNDDVLDEVCFTPLNIKIDTVTCSTSTISWDSLETSLSYSVKIRQFEMDDWSEAIEVKSNTYNFSGLIGCTTYEVIVKSNCAEKQSEYSNIYTFSTIDCYAGATLNCQSPPPACFTPIYIKADSIECESALIEWRKFNDDTAISYDLEYRKINGDWNVLNQINNNYRLTGLDTCSIYQAKVKTNCSNDSSGYSPIIQFKTKCSDEISSCTEAICFTPSNLIADSISCESVFIIWDSLSINSFLNYDLEYREIDNEDWIKPNEEINHSNLKLDSLKPCTNYIARLRSICTDDLKSNYSENLEFETKCPVEDCIVPIDDSDITNVIELSFNPNPVDDVLVIEQSSSNTKPVTFDIKIIDFSGKVHLHQHNELLYLGKSISINTSKLAQGLYMVYLFNDENTITNKISVVR